MLAPLKVNLALPQPSLAFTILNQANGLPALSWLGPSPWTADQLVAGGPQPLPAISAVDQAREFLEDVLAEGARTSREIWNLAQEQGLAERTIQRAKKDLGIRCVRVRVDERQLSYWLLRGQELPASVPPEAVPPDLEQWLAPLREKYPSPSPLDDL